VILGDGRSYGSRPDGQTTLDTLFRRAVAQHPDALALVDPPNRADFTDGPPRRLSYAEADQTADAIASQLNKLGLHPDTVVGIALPNTVEMVLTLLGVLRAGLIAAPLPLLWRRAEIGGALSRIGAKIIITTSHVDGFDHCDLAMQVAAELFAIRHICAFGRGAPDGVIALDGSFSGTAEPTAIFERSGEPALHVALVTWEVTRAGLVAVARNHAELIAGGVEVLLKGEIKPEAAILGCCAPSSFAGLALTVMPWLLSGGTLCLHHAFDATAFAAQGREQRCDTMAVPGPVLPRLAAAGLFDHPELRNVLALWRAPERLPTSAAWLQAGVGLVDLLAFGEAAIVGMRRGAGSLPMALPSGPITSPRDVAGAAVLAEIAHSAAGSLTVRGAMVPRHAFPLGAERLSEPHWRASATGFVDTGYPCRHDPTTNTMQVTGPPPGIVSVGGYRFTRRELDDLVRQAWSGASIAALPDALNGQRLAGIAGDTDGARAALASLGANAMITGAFGNRRRFPGLAI
jgi:hypothetical protein